jgi:putative heme iron utilization protein
VIIETNAIPDPRAMTVIMVVVSVIVSRSVFVSDSLIESSSAAVAEATMLGTQGFSGLSIKARGVS